MNEIFVSYRREESAEICGRMYDRLETLLGAGHVFKDVDTIPAGVDFRTHLTAALTQCRAALVLIGPQWLSSARADGQPRLLDPNDFVRSEVETLLARHIPVIPVLVYGATMPSSEQLPPSLAQLAYRQAVVVRGDPDFRRDIDHVVTALRPSLGLPYDQPANQGVSQPAGHVPPPASGISPTAAVSLRWRGRFVVLALAVLAAGATVALSYKVALPLAFVAAVLALLRAMRVHRTAWIVTCAVCLGMPVVLFAAPYLGLISTSSLVFKGVLLLAVVVLLLFAVLNPRPNQSLARA